MLPEIILVILSPIRSFICVEGTSDAFLQSSALWSRCAWLGLVDTKGCHHCSPPLPSLSSAAPSVTLNRSTHFIVKIKIYSICNKNIESAHLRTSSHLKTAEHISNKKKIYDTSGTSQPPGRLRKEMGPLYFLLQMPQKGPRGSREHLL